MAHLIKTTLHTKPANGATHWSVRTVAAHPGISKTSVQRCFQLFGLQPHRTESFKLSNDPFFIEKLRDVVGCAATPSRPAPSARSTRAWMGPLQCIHRCIVFVSKVAKVFAGHGSEVPTARGVLLDGARPAVRPVLGDGWS